MRRLAFLLATLALLAASAQAATVVAGTKDISLNMVFYGTADGKAKTALDVTKMTMSYVRSAAPGTSAGKTALTALAKVDTAHTDYYGIECDSTNMPGYYRLDWPDAAFAAGAQWVDLFIVSSEAAHVAAVHVDLVVLDVQTAFSSQTIKAVADNVNADMVKISGDSDAADNAELAFDGTGYGFAKCTMPTTTTVTNQLAASAIATAFWQDTTAGDFTVKDSIGLNLYVQNCKPGAAGGLALVGSNMGTTTSLTGDPYAALTGNAVDLKIKSMVFGTAPIVDVGFWLTKAAKGTVDGYPDVTLAAAQGLYAPAKAGANMGTTTSLTGDPYAALTGGAIDLSIKSIAWGTIPQTDLPDAPNAKAITAFVKGGWDAATKDYAVAGSFGEAVSAIRTRVELALPNAAADGKGGLPISDAGGLDLDTKLNYLDNSVAGVAKTLSTVAEDVLAALSADGKALAQPDTTNGPLIYAIVKAGGTGDLAAMWTLNKNTDVKSSTLALASMCDVKSSLLATAANLIVAQATLTKVETMLEADGANWRYTTPSLVNGPGAGAAPTVAQIGTYLDASSNLKYITATPPTAAQNATATLSVAIPGAYPAGSVGYIIGTYLDKAISTRAAPADVKIVIP